MPVTLSYARPPQRPVGWWLAVCSVVAGALGAAAVLVVIVANVAMGTRLEQALVWVRLVACCGLPMGSPLGLVMGLVVVDGPAAVSRLAWWGIGLNGFTMFMAGVLVLVA